MIRLITTLAIGLFLFVNTVFSQEITGDWYGQIDIQGTKLKISFHIKQDNGVYTTTMDSPDQKAFGIPTDKTDVINNTITVVLKSAMINYKGTLKGDKIKGSFTQNGMAFPLDLSHKKVKSKKKVRPQTPKKPYSYKNEEVSFVNKQANNIKLAGTLTLPNNVEKPAVAILISGSGPQNRDSEVLGHKPFLVIADYLTKNGIAVLRYDDRGVSKSEGTQKNATSADFATDVQAAINYLKTRTDINTTKIGLIGHSEGGFIAPMVASKNKDVAFIVLLAGTGVDGAEVLITQSKKMMELSKLPQNYINYKNEMFHEMYKLVKETNNNDELKSALTTYLNSAKKNAPESVKNELTNQLIKMQVQTLTMPWMTYFVRTNPQQFLKKTTCPVLALNGAKDFQVLPKLNLNGIEKGLKRNKDVTITVLANLNHLFQTCETGAFSEYANIEETFSPKALSIISKWINSRF